MAGLLALAGESPFRARAYERAATAIEHLDVDLAALVEAGRLTELPGIGRGIAAMIAELQRTGRSRRWTPFASACRRERSRSVGSPASDSTRSGHFMPRSASRPSPSSGRPAKRDACAVSRAWGRRRSAASSIGSEPSRDPVDVRLRLDRALALAESFTAHLRAAPGVIRAEIAGALRRRAETVDRLVFVAAARGTRSP